MSDLFGDEVDVAPNRQRVWPIVAGLIGLGLVFGGIFAFVVSATTGYTRILIPAIQQYAGIDELPTVTEVEGQSGVTLPAESVIERPRDRSIYLIGQVRLPAGTGNPLEAGYVEVSDIPRHSLSVWDGELDDPRYYLGAEGRSALTGEHEGTRVIVFYEGD